MATKTPAAYLAAAAIEYLGEGLWRADLEKVLNLTVDIEAPETATQDEVRAAMLPAVTSILAPPQTADSLVPASVAVETAVAAAMATVAITSPTLSEAQKVNIQAEVTAKVQQVIDERLGGSSA